MTTINEAKRRALAETLADWIEHVSETEGTSKSRLVMRVRTDPRASGVVKEALPLVRTVLKERAAQSKEGVRL